MTDTKRRLRKHGLSYTPEYRAWQQMRLRCTDPKHAAWPDYGGRGITVCDAWLDSPQQFLADMGTKPTPQHELDRKDNAGPYSPSNCRWVVRAVNCRNRRSNRLIEHAGETLPMAAWAERTGINKYALQKRLAAGWSAEKALTTPVRPKRSALAPANYSERQALRAAA
jgi:ribosomal protein S16